MEDQQELTRSHSMPVINREEIVIKKVQEQDGIISLMQTQIEFQNETIAKHDKAIESLLSKVEELTEKLKTLEDNLSQQSDSADQNAVKSALWSSSSAKVSSENPISIADLVKETAEQTLGIEPESGYIYDEKLGLYYDQSSGYYYDPVKQLFYNGHTKTYYSFDSASNSYHEVQVTAEGTKRKKSKKPKKTSSKQQKINNKSNSDRNDPLPSENDSKIIVINDENIENDSGSRSPQRRSISDMEEGEISSSSPTSAESSPGSAQTCSGGSDHEDQAKYPPCIRAVVQSAPPDLKKGTLFLVPCTGGTIGSSELSSIYLPFSFIEETHAKIEYQPVQSESESPKESECSTDQETVGKYLITDLGSQEGTYINRSRLSLPGVQSDPHELVHGSTVVIGDITLLIHIHPGDFTCGHCEPGLLLQKDPMYEYTGKTAENIRKSELKKVKKKYGLDRKKANVQSGEASETSYKDRAKDRRLKIGSDNPFAKTEVASTEVPINVSNKGFKMLQKMGWKGESLGSKESEGIKEPINCELKTDRGGLGFNGPSLPSATPSSNESSKKSKKLAKTIERFNEANNGSPKNNMNLDY